MMLTSIYVCSLLRKSVLGVKNFVVAINSRLAMSDKILLKSLRGSVRVRKRESEWERRSDKLPTGEEPIIYSRNLGHVKCCMLFYMKLQ